MPHLSPLNWLFMPTFFWLLLLSLSSILWWSQMFIFVPSSSSFSKPKILSWSW